MNFTVDEMNSFLEENLIVDNVDQDFNQSFEQLWQKNQALLQQQGGYEFLLEFMGFRHEQLPDPLTQENQQVISVIIRITVWQTGNNVHALQSWLQLFPEGSKEQLKALNTPIKQQRIAWNE